MKKNLNWTISTTELVSQMQLMSKELQQLKKKGLFVDLDSILFMNDVSRIHMAHLYFACMS